MPTRKIPIVQIEIKVNSKRGLMAFLSMIKEGKLNVVTDIIKASTVPNKAPLANRASATGIVPKISAYIGMPTKVARKTPTVL